MLRVGAQGVGAHGGCFLDLEFFQQKIYSGSEDVDLRSSFSIFSQQTLSIVQSTAASFPTFRPGLPVPLLHHYNTISTVAVLQAATQLEVMCLRFRVQRDVLPSIEKSSSCSLRLACCCTGAIQLLYSSTCSPITTQRLLVEEVVRLVAPTLWRMVARLEYLLPDRRPPHRHAA